MKAIRWCALPAAVGLAVSLTALASPAASAQQSPVPRVALRGSLAPAHERAHPAGRVRGDSTVSFDLLLAMRNAAGAQRFLRQVSSPGSAKFHRYLTDAQWESRYGPTRAEVVKAESWLRHEGFTVGALARDHLFVSAHGSARTVEHAFGVKLGYFRVNGHKVRLAESPLTIPSSLAGVVSGAVGVNEYVATAALAGPTRASAAQTAAVRTAPGQEPAPPAGFRNPQPCSAYWGQKTDTKDSGSLYKPYTHPLPYDICGYKPAQLRGAYGLAGSVARGDDGKGTTIAIVDAYDSPNLLANAQQYFRRNDPAHPLATSQFTNVAPASVFDQGPCGGSGWYGEQALDVEASHTMAPGAHIEYVGARSCLDSSLLAAVTTAVTSGASVVTDSWDDLLGDLFTDAATKTAYDDTFMLAAATGVSVLFCSHDYGDNFATFGLTIPNYPASSPYVTAVGGTALEINAKDQAQADYGWSTAHQPLCASKTTNCGSATKPAGPLAYAYGSAGGTSYYYTEPWYQDKVVPQDLALRNEAVNGPVPYRVYPDISMDADVQTGMLIGLTQAFPSGTYYSQYKIGGTSLASPLFAGVIADADQAAGTSLGFLNPLLYRAYAQTPAAFDDILPPAHPHSAAEIRVDYGNLINPADGYTVELETTNYEGPEVYCDATGNCATRDVSLTTAKGFDSMTGLGTIGSRFITTLSKF
jgi:subtilase family serine protease